MKKNIAVLCGGASYEHEVSIITGIQVAEELDKEKYTLSLVYFDKDNTPFLIRDFKTKKDFFSKKRKLVNFAKIADGSVVLRSGGFRKDIGIDACYLAFHGGTGESGQIHGLCELLGIPHTAPSQEGSVISMNKSLTKEVLNAHKLSTLPSVSVHSVEYGKDKNLVLTTIKNTFNFPVILKPVHLGSSIAIEIAHNEVELEKYMNVAVRVDNEILVEPALVDFVEFNVSARSNADEIELSPIEEPLREDEILSFDDKYANGSKKSGGKQGGGGMELLDRTLPAKISEELATEILELTKAVYRATRLSGLVRIDFMYSEGKLYCTEINPIPGSMSFYLWEPTGEQFREQVTQCIEDAFLRFSKQIEIEPYETDIVKKFIG